LKYVKRPIISHNPELKLVLSPNTFKIDFLSEG